MTLGLNAGTRLISPGGACLTACLSLEKIACHDLKKDSSVAKCVNESSTAALCNSDTFNIYLKKYPNGTYTILVNGTKELIVEWSPVCVTAEFSRTTTDLMCYYNGSASGMLLNIRCM